MKQHKDVLATFDEILAEVRELDRSQARNIRTALRKHVGELYEEILDIKAPAHKRVLASKEARIRLLELQYHYARIEAQMTRQRAYFLQTAAEAAAAFLDTVYNEMDAYFEQLYDQVAEVLRRDSTWATGLVDTLKKTGGKTINLAWRGACNLLQRSTDKGTVNVADKLLTKVAGARGKRVAEVVSHTASSVRDWVATRQAKVVEDRTLLEETLEQVCSAAEISRHMEEIFARAARRCEEVWQRRVAAYHKEIAITPGLAGAPLEGVQAQPEFTLGAAEQTLAASLGATVFGTAALAAGWHTLAYAMANVFWPLTVFVAVITTGVAMLTKERAIQDRIASARKVLNMYHAQLVMYIHTAKLPEYQGRTQRDAIYGTNVAAAEKLDAAWCRERFGGIPSSVYAKLAQTLAEEQRRLQALEETLARQVL